MKWSMKELKESSSGYQASFRNTGVRILEGSSTELWEVQPQDMKNYPKPLVRWMLMVRPFYESCSCSYTITET